jgi:short-subunit dehydrogenase
MAKLENQVAIVTGASSGIGDATARLLAEHGARVVVSGRREERLSPLAAETGGVAVAGDIVDADVRRRILEACGGRVDMLVNNAGYGLPGPVETVEEEAYRRQFEVNFFAAAAMMRAVMPGMRARRSGRIVNVSSVAGRYGYPLFGWYCATKHALEGLSDAARLELGPWGIKVVLIEPGPVRTEFFGVSRQRAEPQLQATDSPYAAFFAHTEKIERQFSKLGVKADKVARLIVKAILKRRPRARYSITAVAKASLFLNRYFPRPCLDGLIRKQFRVPKSSDVS